MKKYRVLFLMAVFILCAGFVFAETDQDNNGYNMTAGPGMEEKKINNDVTVLMPKGSKMRRRNESTQIMEGVDEYSARKFVTVDKRLERIEKEAAEMKEEIRGLKSKLSDIGKSSNEALPKDAEI